MTDEHKQNLVRLIDKRDIRVNSPSHRIDATKAYDFLADRTKAKMDELSESEYFKLRDAWASTDSGVAAIARGVMPVLGITKDELTRAVKG